MNKANEISEVDQKEFYNSMIGEDPVGVVIKGLLPPSMKEWADQIRLIGNEGAHEPEGLTMDDPIPMRGFTEAFLRYFITIPFQVALRRGKINSDGKPVTIVA